MLAILLVFALMAGIIPANAIKAFAVDTYSEAAAKANADKLFSFFDRVENGDFDDEDGVVDYNQVIYSLFRTDSDGASKSKSWSKGRNYTANQPVSIPAESGNGNVYLLVNLLTMGLSGNQIQVSDVADMVGDEISDTIVLPDIVKDIVRTISKNPDFDFGSDNKELIENLLTITGDSTSFVRDLQELSKAFNTNPSGLQLSDEAYARLLAIWQTAYDAKYEEMKNTTTTFRYYVIDSSKPTGYGSLGEVSNVNRYDYVYTYQVASKTLSNPTWTQEQIESAARKSTETILSSEATAEAALAIQTDEAVYEVFCTNKDTVSLAEFEITPAIVAADFSAKKATIEVGEGADQINFNEIFNVDTSNAASLNAALEEVFKLLGKLDVLPLANGHTIADVLGESTTDFAKDFIVLEANKISPIIGGIVESYLADATTLDELQAAITPLVPVIAQLSSTDLDFSFYLDKLNEASAKADAFVRAAKDELKPFLAKIKADEVTVNDILTETQVALNGLKEVVLYVGGNSQTKDGLLNVFDSEDVQAVKDIFEQILPVVKAKILQQLSPWEPNEGGEIFALAASDSWLYQHAVNATDGTLDLENLFNNINQGGDGIPSIWETLAVKVNAADLSDEAKTLVLDALNLVGNFASQFSQEQVLSKLNPTNDVDELNPTNDIDYLKNLLGKYIYQYKDAPTGALASAISTKSEAIFDTLEAEYPEIVGYATELFGGDSALAEQLVGLIFKPQGNGNPQYLRFTEQGATIAAEVYKILATKVASYVAEDTLYDFVDDLGSLYTNAYEILDYINTQGNVALLKNDVAWTDDVYSIDTDNTLSTNYDSLIWGEGYYAPLESLGVTFEYRLNDSAAYYYKIEGNRIVPRGPVPQKVGATLTAYAVTKYNDRQWDVLLATKDIEITKASELLELLRNAIDVAEVVTIPTISNAGGLDIAPANQWTTSAATTAFAAAIATANDTYDTLQTQVVAVADIVNAVSDLNVAKFAFESSIKDGLLVAPENKTVELAALQSAITVANTALSSVQISADGLNVLPDDTWVSESAYIVFANAIFVAQNVADDSNSSKADIVNATDALAIASTAFASAQAPGTKDTTPVVDNTAVLALLQNAITDAYLTSITVKSSVNGVGIDSSEKWVTEEVHNAFGDQILIALSVYLSGTSTLQDIVAAISNLNIAKFAIELEAQDGLGDTEIKGDVVFSYESIPTVITKDNANKSILKVGKTLSVSDVRWNKDLDEAATYKWYADGNLIANATGKTYKLTAAELGKTIAVEVTGISGKEFDRVKSNPTAKVAKGTLVKGKIKITGKAKVGKKLTAKKSGWSPSPKYAYKWYANGKAIKGATKATLKLKKAQVGKKITVKVTVTKAGYTTVKKASAKTKKVVK
ncbi:MAG: hypothetical protein LBN34_09135 [Clostridiales Family XIII bacterium]|jgi:hypothetical protein|nr:hypothetical protein [Clostridiales Family XIII bacterium]